MYYNRHSLDSRTNNHYAFIQSFCGWSTATHSEAYGLIFAAQDVDDGGEDGLVLLLPRFRRVPDPAGEQTVPLCSQLDDHVS